LSGVHNVPDNGRDLKIDKTALTGPGVKLDAGFGVIASDHHHRASLRAQRRKEVLKMVTDTQKRFKDARRDKAKRVYTEWYSYAKELGHPEHLASVCCSA